MNFGILSDCNQQTVHPDPLKDGLVIVRFYI
ncbi:unnamed protein product [Acanthoscelides obtectus]|uniref:Uncharacterized protein n=1 Tax=Acanthoscelides obtectus TaxID=200917 RepID=A0A9P0M9A0_ACAOB|nr:unnamed protein product [Acanthoscelides obtectus]CAK1655769.1 hypothetical protein AOBTE_LOCUS19319 [Acanthoscelides obtectus]